jgi:hypothetical protein
MGLQENAFEVAKTILKNLNYLEGSKMATRVQKQRA